MDEQAELRFPGPCLGSDFAIGYVDVPEGVISLLCAYVSLIVTGHKTVFSSTYVLWEIHKQ